jgi:hypothetical protein
MDSEDIHDPNDVLPFGAAFNQTNPETALPEHKDQPESQSDLDEPMLTADDNSHHVEKMSLEQKKDLLTKYNFTATLQVGTFVDAADTTNNFLLS